jgi:hypothetical protein
MYFHLFLFRFRLLQVIAMDQVTDPGYEAQRAAFYAHIVRVRQIIGETCWLFLAVEANIGGHVAGQHYDWLRQYNLAGNTTLVTERGYDAQPGVSMTESMKTCIVNELFVDLEQKRVRLFADVVGQEIDHTIRDLGEQLGRFSRWTKAAAKPGQRTHATYSGKGPTGSLNDDMAIALMWAVSVARLIVSPAGSVKYGTAAKRFGLILSGSRRSSTSTSGYRSAASSSSSRGSTVFPFSWHLQFRCIRFPSQTWRHGSI